MGVNWDAVGRLARSDDGLAWEVLEVAIGSPLYAAGEVAGLWLGVGDAGLVLSATDTAGGWEIEGSTVVGGGFRESLLAVAEWQGGVVAVGANGSILTDAGSGQWSVVDSPSSAHLFGLGAGPDLLVAAGSEGAILVTADGVSWESLAPVTSADLRGVTWGDGRFVAVGTEGTVLISEDGFSWSVVPAATEQDLSDVTWAEGLFVGVGRRGTVITSADGLDWTLRDPGPPRRSLVAVVRHQGDFVALETEAEPSAFPEVAPGGVLVSSDGVEWERREFPTEAPVGTGRAELLSISSTGDELIIVGSRGFEVLLIWPYPFEPFPPFHNVIVRTADLATWEVTEVYGGFGLHGVVATEAGEVAVGQTGAVLRRGGPPPSFPACEPGPHVLCLQESRFQVEAAWCDPFGDVGCGQARAVPMTEETGSFWFFDEENLELMVKVLDGRDFNDRFWLFAGSLSDVVYTLTVTDTATARSETFYNAPGQLRSFKDMGTFFEVEGAVGSAGSVAPAGGFATTGVASIPAPLGGPGLLPAAGCVPGPEHLCLQGERFRVSVEWCDPFGDAGCGTGKTVPLTADAGSFWFFNEENLELMVKVLDGRAFNNRFWIFWGALSDVEYWITVEDTATGAEQVYYNAPAELASGKDMEAFE